MYTCRVRLICHKLTLLTKALICYRRNIPYTYTINITISLDRSFENPTTTLSANYLVSSKLATNSPAISSQSKNRKVNFNYDPQRLFPARRLTSRSTSSRRSWKVSQRSHLGRGVVSRARFFFLTLYIYTNNCESCRNDRDIYSFFFNCGESRACYSKREFDKLLLSKIALKWRGIIGQRGWEFIDLCWWHFKRAYN